MILDMYSKIVAIDPGKTTGYAVLQEDVPVSSGELHKYEGFENLIDRKDMLVICERPFMSRSVDPIVFQVFGAVQYQCYIVGCTLTYQGGDSTHFVWKRYKNELSKKSISTSFSQHKKDAIAHLVYYWAHKEMRPASEFFAMMKNKGE